MIDRNCIPAHWEVKKLGEVCEKITNGSSAKQYEDKVGHPISRIETIWNGTIDYSRVKYVVENDDVFVEKYSLKNGDILFSHINSDIHLGKTALYKMSSDTALIHGINLLLLRTNHLVISEFFNYQLKFLRSSGLFISIAQKSVNQSSINQAKLKQVDVIIPPLTEQQEIVAKLEELFSELDKGKEQLETARQQLKVYRQAVLKWAFEGKLSQNHRLEKGLKDYTDYKSSSDKEISEIPKSEKISDSDILPEGWKNDFLGNFIDKIEAGKSFQCDERPPIEKEIGIVKVSSVSWGEFNEQESKTIYSKNQFNSNYLINKGDFLFSRANTIDLVGSCVIVKQISKQLMLSDKILRFIFSEEISKEYVLHFLRTRKGRREIESNSTGNQESMRNIGQQRIRQIMIPVPSLEEQHQIVQEIESRLSVCDKVEESISQSLLQAETLRQSILKQAFEGKLVKAKEVAEPIIKAQEEKIISFIPDEEFPRKIASISAIDLHAGILALVIDAHEINPEHLPKLNHVKGEKIAHQVEYMLGISLGRQPVKDAAGPDDFNHLKKVEHRATKAGWFKTQKLAIGHTYTSMQGMQNIIARIRQSLSDKEFKEVNNLIETFLKFEMEHAEVIATLFAGWNNLLLTGKSPSDDEIVYESRENWSKRKLSIERDKFYKALTWMKSHGFIPLGKGMIVS